MQHGHGPNAYWSCDACQIEGSFDLSEGHCALCPKGNEICIGCSHTCSVCDREICKHHIVVTPLANHMGVYICTECDEKNQAKEAA